MSDYSDDIYQLAANIATELKLPARLKLEVLYLSDDDEPESPTIRLLHNPADDDQDDLCFALCPHGIEVYTPEHEFRKAYEFEPASVVPYEHPDLIPHLQAILDKWVKYTQHPITRLHHYAHALREQLKPKVPDSYDLFVDIEVLDWPEDRYPKLELFTPDFEHRTFAPILDDEIVLYKPDKGPDGLPQEEDLAKDDPDLLQKLQEVMELWINLEP
jgi:hypothetical protein